MAFKHLFLSAVAVAVLAACNSENSSTEAQTPVVTEAPKALVSGIDKTQADNSVRAQDDLFRAVNGTWLKTFEIPADRSNYGSFTKLNDDAQANIKTIIEEAGAASDATPGSEKQKVGDFFKSWMDEAKVNELGGKPLQPYLAAVDAIKDKKEWARYHGTLQKLGVRTPVGVGINADEKNPNINALYFRQSGLGLPDRDFYLEPEHQAKRDAYVAHITKMFELAGVKDAAAGAKKVLAFEHKLAEVSWTREANRDPVKTYNPMQIQDLVKSASAYDWQGFLDVMGISEKNVIVVQPSFMNDMSKVIAATPIDDLKLHAKWHLITNAAGFLSKEFDDENFAFYGKTLNGQQQQQPRWKRGVEVIDGSVGEAVGKIYVEKHFSPDAKIRMEALVKNLLQAYGEGIDSLEWMTPETKKAAREKLAKFTYKIGYPDRWRDYSSLTIVGGDLFGNATRAAEFEYNRQLAKLGKPVDRSEWFMTPQTVNAYYNPNGNEIVFPAAILQPPFFNMDADDAVNYGGIGAVIGHEVGHGFDDQGSQYDGDGMLRSWWTDADRKEFEVRVKKLAAQYDKFEALPGKFVKGEFTSGENIGDLSGMTIAYRAYHISLQGKEAAMIDGLNGDQRFFMGWAQVWSRKYRDQALEQRLITDPHSPSEFRCNGVIRNMPEFYAAFDVKEGDKLYLPEAERVKIW